MNLAQPDIALLVPCYNAAPYLSALHASIAAQPFQAAEIILYDDGSTDDTAHLADALGLRCIAGGYNRGVSTARNRLAAAASSRWIHFCDADDPLHPQFFTKLAPYCTPDYDVISCDADWRDDRSGEVILAWRYEASRLASDPAAYLLERPMSLTNTIIRRECWHKIKGCDESLAMWEDADAHFRLAMAGARFFHLPEVLSVSIRRNTSFSHDYLKNWQCRMQWLERDISRGLDRRLAPIAANELGKAAAALLLFKDKPGTQRALDLARKLGYPQPNSRNPAFKILRWVLDDFHLLRLQEAWRKRKASAVRTRS